MNMVMHVTAPISLMWTGFLLLEIPVKRSYLKGSSKTLISNHIPVTSLITLILNYGLSSPLCYAFLESLIRGGEAHVKWVRE